MLSAVLSILGMYMAWNTYTIGVQDLDKLIGGLSSHTMVLIVGHPGAGKTTMASKICYSNALNNKKCLYITFYEDKEKLFNNMGRLGIDLAGIEARGLLRYIRLPVILSEDVLSSITQLLSEDSYSVVVLDSINPIIEFLERKDIQRAVLLNFFYQLSMLIEGIVVAVAEIPFGRESLDLGAIEFVADVVIYLKHRVEHGLLSRVMEIRKIRGAPIYVVEVPFAIDEGYGIKMFVPPKPDRIVSGADRHLNAVLGLTRELLPMVRPGDVVYATYPPGARSPMAAVPLIDLAVANDLRALFISFTYSVDEMKNIISGIFENFFGIERELTRQVVDKYFTLESFNPAAYSLTQLNMMIVELIEDLNPDIVAFHGGEIFRALVRDLNEFWVSHKNLLIWLKNRGKLVVRYCARVDPLWVKVHESMSDIVVHSYIRRRGSEIIPWFYVWRSGSSPKILKLSEEDLKRATREAEKLGELIRQKLSKRANL